MIGAWLLGALSLLGQDEGPTNAYHRVLHGSLGNKLDVQMVLEKRDTQLNGFYYYKNDRTLLSLEGEVSDWDSSL